MAADAEITSEYYKKLLQIHSVTQQQ